MYLNLLNDKYKTALLDKDEQNYPILTLKVTSASLMNQNRQVKYLPVR